LPVTEAVAARPPVGAAAARASPRAGGIGLDVAVDEPPDAAGRAHPLRDVQGALPVPRDERVRRAAVVGLTHHRAAEGGPPVAAARARSRARAVRALVRNAVLAGGAGTPGSHDRLGRERTG